MTFHMPNSYYDPPDYSDQPRLFGKDERRHARLEHKCDACSDPIKPGEYYWRSIGENEDGAFVVSKMHVLCPLLRDFEEQLRLSGEQT
jgi:hypothetical protein